MAVVKPVLLLFTGIFFQPFLSGQNEKKVCKVVKEVVKFRENFAYSGQLVRVSTTEVHYEECSDEQPNCCKDTGCCDTRGWKVLMVIIVGCFTAVLFLAFVGVIIYSACCNSKHFSNQESKREEVEQEDDANQMAPRYDMTTYLTAAGFNLAVIPKQGPPRSAIQPSEHTAPDECSSDSSE